MSLPALNKFIHDLQFPEIREQYARDATTFLSTYELTEKEIAAVDEADFRTLWLLGVNPYLLRFFQHWNHITDDEFRAALEGLFFPGSTIQGEKRG